MKPAVSLPTKGAPPGPQKAPPKAAFPFWHLLVIAALCFAVYANALSGAFVWDDEIQVVKNPDIRSLSNLPKAFTSPAWSFANAGGANQSNFFRPLQTVAYTLSYAMGELSTTPYHVFNLLFHIAASVFVYLIAMELAIPAGAALLAAALFSVHPIHTEAVTWIAATPDVACGAFGFASIWAFLKSNQGEDRGWLIASAALFFAALLAKEMAIPLPAVLFLLMLRSGSRKWAVFVPYVAAGVLYLALRIYALGFVATTQVNVNASIVDWLTLGIRAFGEYAWQVIVGWPLSAYHLIAIHFADRVPETITALAFTVAVAGAAWFFRKQLPEAWILLVAFAVMLVPVFYFKGISLALISERYLYVPSLAVALLVGFAFAKWNSRSVTYAAWAVVAVFAVMTVMRNRDWQDSEKLYTETLAHDPENAYFHLNLAEIILKRGDDASAKEHLAKAADVLAAGKYTFQSYETYRAFVGLGTLEARKENYTPARAYFERARQAYPNGEWPYLYLGNIAMAADNNAPLAISYLNKAIELGPINEVARDAMGVVLFNVDRIPEAIAQFQEALRIDPTFKPAQEHLQLALQKGR